jgi:hypothetical protein
MSSIVSGAIGAIGDVGKLAGNLLIDSDEDSEDDAVQH